MLEKPNETLLQIFNEKTSILSCSRPELWDLVMVNTLPLLVIVLKMLLVAILKIIRFRFQFHGNNIINIVLKMFEFMSLGTFSTFFSSYLSKKL